MGKKITDPNTDPKGFVRQTVEEIEDIMCFVKVQQIRVEQLAAGFPGIMRKSLCDTPEGIIENLHDAFECLSCMAVEIDTLFLHKD